MPPRPRAASEGAEEDFVMHVRSSSGSTHTPVSVDNPAPVEFELDNFRGRCIFMHRPSWSYDSPETPEQYPYRQLFHKRKRLWEWRLQGKFIRRPGVLYVGIELEEYVPVNFATRSLMRGILPLIQAALQCKMVHHEVGDPNESELRPTVVAPIWAADNMLVHEDPSEVPDLAAPDLPMGFNRKAARQYWETLWQGGEAADWADGSGPTYTFALWGPSQLLDLRAWVFRKLPLMWGRELAMEPFCGRQPVHAVVYELSDGQLASKHYQSEKTYVADLRMMPAAVWASRVIGDEGNGCRSPERAASTLVDDDAQSFCSALSGDSPELDQEQHLLAVEAADSPGVVSATSSSRSRSPFRREMCLDMDLALSDRISGRKSRIMWLIKCARCRKRRSSSRTELRVEQMV